MNDQLNAELFVQLRVRCPECGKREARRVARWRLSLYQHADPERIVETVACACGHLYAVKARAYQEAVA